MYQFFKRLHVRYWYSSIGITILLCVLNIHIFSGEIHTVKKGETLYRISKQYGVSIDVLTRFNNIGDASLITAGTNIIIPDEYTTQVEQYQSYSVEKGDTLYGIAHTFGISINAIRELNVLSSDTLYVGQELSLPYAVADNDSTTAIVSENQDREIATEPLKQDKKSIAVRVDTSTSSPTTSLMDNLREGESQSIADLFVNAIPAGTVSEKWPVSGKSYELRGKIPGVIIEGHENTMVKSIAAGIVLYAAFHSSFSNVIIIQGNDGTVYVYGGQGELKVKQGDYVKAGQTIGALGLMPLLQKPILYFSIWKNNKFINPTKFIS